MSIAYLITMLPLLQVALSKEGSKVVQMKLVKYIDTNLPASTVTINRRFEGESLSRLTCAMMTKLTGEDGYIFNDDQKLCQVLTTKTTTIDMKEGDDVGGKLVKVRLHRGMFEKKAVKVPDKNLNAVVLLGNNKKEKVPVAWQVLLPNGEICHNLKRYPLGPRYALEAGLLFNPEDEHLYYCFGFESRTTGRMDKDGCFRMSVTSPRPEWRSMELSELGKLAENPFTWQPSSLALFRTELLTAVIKFVLGKSRDLYLLHYDLFQPKFGWRMHRQKHSLEAYIRHPISILSRQNTLLVTDRGYNNYLLNYAADEKKLIKIVSKIKFHSTVSSITDEVFLEKSNKSGYLYFSGKSELNLFTLNEESPMDSIWTNLTYPKRYTCLACAVFNLGDRNIWAQSMAGPNYSSYKFNVETEQFEFHKNSSLDKMGKGNIAKIPLKYVHDDCKDQLIN